ncbi:hypothetical protein D8674_030497 [Pyrus ussuriensis x Pyrus communis]|uniref:No apical meristem-associated C-terminal domain-containing protein n=1 Tax=Pyrus ussuriensis x Pyrus communis TaxID=2448454 RepID=A0A5N5EWB4_9ROSA|nr:hypothetical protein D8674_030497 [Pyrus ussuriensis x Pyrus communis]
MVVSAMKGRAWTQKEDEALCRAYRWPSEYSVRGSSQTSEGVWTHPPQERVGPTPVFGNASSNAEKGKTKDNYAFQQEMASLLRLMAEQNAFATEERSHRHEERAKQIQEEMDDRNMQRIISDYTLMSKAYFDRKMREIMARQELFTSDYNPTMADDDDDDDYRL